MKVYVLVFDYLGYEEQVVGIFSTQEKAEKYITEEFNTCKYTNDIKKYLDDSEYSLVERELDTNKKQKLKIRL
ncbi:MAG: hypothetical protein SPC26_05395 [Lactobacillus amylovorus]|nr:hypothetical protein [Lactobacillus amylovorus]